MKKLLPFLVLIIIFVLSSCNDSRTPSVPGPVPTNTPVPADTSTITETPTVTQTFTPQWCVAGTGPASSGPGRWCSLGGDGTNIYVIYIDETNSNIATVKTLSGGFWVDVAGGTISAGASERTTLYVDGTNLYAAYMEGSPQKPTVRKYDGSGWSTVGSAQFAANLSTIWQQSLCASGSNVYIACTDDTDTSVKVYQHGGSNWAQLGANVSDSLGWYSAVRFYGSTPYVFYENGAYDATVKYYPASS